MKIRNNSHLFKLNPKLLKYILVALFGLAIAYFLLHSFGTLNMTAPLLVMRLGINLLSLIVIVIIVKSLR